MKKQTIIQIVGYKNSGKTTLICGLIHRLKSHGYRIGTIKHDAHTFEMDHPGKDTWQHTEAGAHIVAITSKHKTAIIEQQPTPLEALIPKLSSVDIIFIEGFKSENYPKIILLKERDHVELLERMSFPLAIAAWFAYESEALPCLDINDLDSIAELILAEVNR